MESVESMLEKRLKSDPETTNQINLKTGEHRTLILEKKEENVSPNNKRTLTGTLSFAFTVRIVFFTTNS